MKKSSRLAEIKAENTIENFKQQYEGEYEALKNREKRLDEEEKEHDQRIVNEVKSIQSKLEKQYQFKSKSLYAFFTGTVLYGFLVTLFQGLKSKYFISDVKVSVNFLKKCIMTVWKVLFINKPESSNWALWLVFLLSVVVAVGFILGFIWFTGKFIYKFYTEYAYDWLSVAVALISFAAAIFFADDIHKWGINWILFLLMVQVIYFFIRIITSDEVRMS